VVNGIAASDVTASPPDDAKILFPGRGTYCGRPDDRREELLTGEEHRLFPVTVTRRSGTISFLIHHQNFH